MPIRDSFLPVALAIAVLSCRDDAVAPAVRRYPGSMASALSLEGNQQVRLAGDPLAPFVVRVTSAAGAPVSGVALAWSVALGTATLDNVTSTTDANGEARAQAIVPDSAQSIAVRAVVTGRGTVTFNARITDGADIVLDTLRQRFFQPVYLTAPVGDPRLFVVQQDGKIRIIKNGARLATPFLDLSRKVSFVGAQGLLSVVFHPNYATNGFFFVNFTDHNGDERIVRYHAAPGSDVATAGSAKLVLLVPQPVESHSGGHMLFGPDNLLFIPTGDADSQGDPLRSGQNLDVLPGKVLRINPNSPEPYRVPASNPWVGQLNARPEIWALGLRNPWRFAIDSGTMYVADVGYHQREEVDVVPVRAPGLNFGWSDMEGTHCRIAPCDPSKYTMPLLEYDHGQGCAVIGGFVYRGTALPELAGHYFYSDFCGGWIRSFRYAGGSATQQKQWTQFPTLTGVTSFGVDGAGELYVLQQDGVILRFRRR